MAIVVSDGETVVSKIPSRPSGLEPCPCPPTPAPGSPENLQRLWRGGSQPSLVTAASGCHRLQVVHTHLNPERASTAVPNLSLGSPTPHPASRNRNQINASPVRGSKSSCPVRSARARGTEQSRSLHRLLRLWPVAAAAPLGTHFPRCKPSCHPLGCSQWRSGLQKQLEGVTQPHGLWRPEKH